MDTITEAIEHTDDIELAIDNEYEEYNKHALEELDRAIDRGVERDGLVEIAECACVQDAEKLVDDRIAEIEYENEQYQKQMEHENEYVIENTTHDASTEQVIDNYRSKMEQLIDNKEILDKLCDNMRNYATRVDVALDEATRDGQELSEEDREKICQDIYVNEGYSDTEHSLIGECEVIKEDYQEIEEETPDLDDDLIP